MTTAITTRIDCIKFTSYEINKILSRDNLCSNIAEYLNNYLKTQLSPSIYILDNHQKMKDNIVELIKNNNIRELCNISADKTIKNMIEELVPLCSDDYVHNKIMNSIATLNNNDFYNLIKYINFDANYQCPSTKHTLLTKACIYGNFDIIKTLIKFGACINYEHPNDSSGSTPIMYAAQKGYLDIVKYLHENGAIINKKNKNNMNAISYATDNKHFHVVKYIINNGADIIDLFMVNRLSMNDINEYVDKL